LVAAFAGAALVVFLAGTGFFEAAFLALAFTVCLLAAPDRTTVCEVASAAGSSVFLVERAASVALRRVKEVDASRLGSGARDFSHKPQGLNKLVKTDKTYQTRDCSRP
jgi:hypothetical protein